MTLSLDDARRVAELLRQVARDEILPRFRRLDPADVHTKSGPLDLVTEADEAAERRITAELAGMFPGCLVVGEENASRHPELLAELAGAELAFLVDPVDGTANFAAGLTLFGVMAAAVVRGEVVAGVIHDPIGNDTAFALRGGGAWIESPDGYRRDLRVARPVPVAAMAGAASWRHFRSPLRETIQRNLGHVAASWDYRCAAHEYRMLCGGYCHYLLFNRLMPWDHAAGWLLHQEAGGYSARLDGTPYRVADTRGGLICAPDQPSWEALRATLLAE